MGMFVTGAISALAVALTVESLVRTTALVTVGLVFKDKLKEENDASGDAE